MSEINSNQNNKQSIFGDNNNSNNSFNTTNNITNIYPKHQSLEEQQKERDKRQRPYLADKKGQLVKGYGYIVRKYNDKCYTVINLTDLNGVYIADHVQMDLKENIYDYKYKSNFIKFEGIVYEYSRSNKWVDYSINISKPVLCCYDSVANCNYNDKLLDIDLDINKFLNYFYKAEYNDLYNEELQNNKFTYESLISLILILASTIFNIETSHTIEISSILSYIAYACNIEQGIYTYNKTPDEFIRFCQGIDIKPNSKRMRKAWSKIILRKYNFGENPNPLNYSKDEISEMAYLLLNDYI